MFSAGGWVNRPINSKQKSVVAYNKLSQFLNKKDVGEVFDLTFAYKTLFTQSMSFIDAKVQIDINLSHIQDSQSFLCKIDDPKIVSSLKDLIFLDLKQKNRMILIFFYLKFVKLNY
jgi:hypothetical protein